MNIATASDETLAASPLARTLDRERELAGDVPHRRGCHSEPVQAQSPIGTVANLPTVVGVKDARRGEAVKAFVVLKPARRGQVSAEDVIAWARGNMAAYKVPTTISFEESLPKSATGKIQWRVLQERENR